MAYTLTSQKGAVVRFEPFETGIIEKESESYSSSITSNPVEYGSDINDHVNNAAGTLTLSGVIVGGDGAIEDLKTMRDSRSIMTYVGVTRMANLIFTSLKFDRTAQNSKGASFSATLKQIETTSPEYVSMDASASMVSQDAGKSDDSQLAKTANKGLIVVSEQSVSSSSAERHSAAYVRLSSSAPLTRETGSYSGVTS